MVRGFLVVTIAVKREKKAMIFTQGYMLLFLGGWRGRGCGRSFFQGWGWEEKCGTGRVGLLQVGWEK